MFEVEEDDLLWSDDFQLEVDEKDKSGGISLELGSLPSKFVADNVAQELPKLDAISSTETALNAFNTHRLHTKCKNDNHKEELAKTCTRKFPGPAGVLPPYSPHAVLDTKLQDTLHVVSQPGSPNVGDLKDKTYNLTWSQAPADDVFASPQWKALVSDLGQDAESLLSKFSIKSVLLKARRKLLHRGKIPLIIGVMDSLDMQGSDASFVIRDPSGKMYGALHRDLFKDPSTALQAGSVLVLRQVSIISPSSRTHYLNITPGNVALIYTASKDAVVSKRHWSALQVVTNDTNFGSEVQMLHQIIDNAKQELSDSLRNCQQGLEVCMSPSMPLGSSKILLQTGLSRGQGHMPSFMPRSPLSVQRHNSNMIGSGNSGSMSSKSSLFSTGPHTVSQITQGRSVNASAISHSATNTTGKVMQFHSKRILPNGLPVLGHACVIDEDKALCNGSAKADRNIVPAIHHENIGSNMISPVVRNYLQVNTTIAPSAAFKTSANIDNDKRNGENLNSFNNDFPDADDQMMLEMCDTVLDQTPVETPRTLVIDDMQVHQEEFSSVTGNMGSGNMSQSIISKVFEDCRKENQRINSNSERLSVFETHSHHTDVGNSKVNIQRGTSFLSVTNSLHSPAISSQTSNGVKQFSFKRTQPLSHTSATSFPAKRPMFSVPSLNTASSTSPLSDIHKTARLNSSLVCNTENSENIPTVYSVSAVPIISSPTNAVALDKPVVNYPVTSVNTVVLSPCVQSLNSAVSGTISDQNVYNKSLMRYNSSSAMDSVKRGCDSFSSAAGRVTSIFPHWDDDLSDDLLLSQLSDDF